MSVKIVSLEAQNVKRLKAVELTPTQDGLNLIGGKNGQGKTSVLDAIAWALGGEKFAPSKPKRADSITDPVIRVTLSNGFVVERSGKNGTLKIKDPSGKKSGQKILDEFIEKLALNLPAFMAMNDKDKAKVLLKIIGVGDQLYELDTKCSALYNRRLEIGRIADQKEKFAKEMPVYPDAPKEPVSASDLIAQQQDILARNGQRQQWLREMQSIDITVQQVTAEMMRTAQHLEDLKAKLTELQEKQRTAAKSPEELEMESTAELEEQLRSIETINAKVRANLDREKADMDAEAYRKQYNDLTSEIDALRADRMALLNGAEMPLDGLSVEEGVLTYHGQAWDNMSGAEQLKCAAAIVRKLNPECGFVLMDKLEQMDLDTLREFGAWLEAEGLQVLATRVSTGEECAVIIEDGYSHGNNTALAAVPAEPKTWKAGEF
jgi:DNA repair exonuclease SbcCD ATPase subunit